MHLTIKSLFSLDLYAPLKFAEIILPSISAKKLGQALALSLLMLCAGPQLATAQSQQAQSAMQARGIASVEQAIRIAQAAGININDTQAVMRLARAQGASAQELQLLEEELRKRNGGMSGSGEVLDLRTANPRSNDRLIATGIKEEDSLATVQALKTDSLNKVLESYRDSLQLAEYQNAAGLEYFGYKLFAGNTDPFTPSAGSAIADSYVVGSGDDLRIIVWGDTEQEFLLTVDPEGRITIPNIGPVLISGRSLGQLRNDLRRRLSDSFSGLSANPPTTFLDVSITRANAVQVYVLGEVKRAGGYTLPYGSDVFNALFAAGGPTLQGSLREVRIVRDGKVAARIDLYDLLIEGGAPEMQPLRTNDRILVVPRHTTVQITGAVRRPGLYETLPNESITELLNYAAGLKATASTERYHIKRVLPMEERIQSGRVYAFTDRNLAQDLKNQNFRLRDGDEIRIDGLSASMDNAVSIKGAVYKPGRYELNTQIRTVRDLILAADSLRDDAFTDYALLYRSLSDSTLQQYRLDVQQALQDVPQHNLPLQVRDSLIIRALPELLQRDSVRIDGQIRQDSLLLPWRENLTLYDVLFQAGGLQDPEYLKSVFLPRADLIRTLDDGVSTEIIPFDLGAALQKGNDEALKPNDRIVIYPKSVETIEDRLVEIFGEVEKGGRQAWSVGMTLEDLLLQAGGFKESAWVAQVEISRVVDELTSNNESNGRVITERLIFPLLQAQNQNEVPYYNEALWDQLLQEARGIELQHRDKVYIRRHPNWRTVGKVVLAGEVFYPGDYTLEFEGETLGSVLERAGGLTGQGYTNGAQLRRQGQNVIIELERILRGDRKADIMLLPNDTLVVPKERFTVEVLGNVGQPGQIKFEPGQRLSYYLGRAGDMLPESQKYVLLTQGNGATYRVKRKGLFKDNPKVEDHAVIRVLSEPQTEENKRLTFKEIVAESTAALTSVLTIVLLIDRLNQP